MSIQSIFHIIFSNYLYRNIGIKLLLRVTKLYKYTAVKNVIQCRETNNKEYIINQFT